MKSKFPDKTDFIIHFYFNGGPPQAIKIEKKKLLTLFYLIGTSILILFFGTLMFLREISINQKLNEKLLAIESKQKIHSLTNEQEASISKIKQERQLATDPSILKNIPEAKLSGDNVNNEKSEFVGTKIVDFYVECFEASCGVKVSMVPIREGVTKGSLLIVLETQLKTTNPIAKRYFIYPEQTNPEDLSQEEIYSLKRKTFQFSRLLNVSTQFDFGKHLIPIAINVYLFDPTGNNTIHERKLIETGGT